MQSILRILPILNNCFIIYLSDCPVLRIAVNYPVEIRFLKAVALCSDPFRRAAHKLLCAINIEDFAHFHFSSLNYSFIVYFSDCPVWRIAVNYPVENRFFKPVALCSDPLT